MGKGHGLLDCFLISVPNARKPTQEQEEEVTEYLKRLQLKDFQSVFASMHAAHQEITRSYTLNAVAAELHKCLKTDHVNAVNAATESGEVPPKSIGTDLMTRVAVAFNAIDYFIASLLNEEPVNNLAEPITEACYKKAVQHMEYLHAQKETSKEKPCTQPTELEIAAILHFPGRLITYQAPLYTTATTLCLCGRIKSPSLCTKSACLLKKNRRRNHQVAGPCTMLAREIQRKNFRTTKSSYYRIH